MAEYQQRMKDWQRMCDSMQGGIRKCDNCPLLKVLCQYKPNEKVDFAEAEQIIEKWVEEHPVVYPTWWEYLEKIFDPEVTKYPNDYRMFGEACENYRIPADIAQKLGIYDCIHRKVRGNP